MAAPEQWWVGYKTINGKIVGEVVQDATKPTVYGGGTVLGPYASRAEAENALDQLHASSPGPPPDLPGPRVPNPFSWTGVIAHWVGDAVGHLTDAAMWKSIGWLALGILLIITGILLWVKQNTGSLPIPFPAPV